MHSIDGLTREILLPQTEEQIKLDMQSVDENNKIESFAKEIQMSSPKHAGNGSLHQLNDAADEFFDVLTEAEYDQTEFWPADENMETPNQVSGYSNQDRVFIQFKQHLFFSIKRSFCLCSVKANDTLMQMVAADWLKSDKREDDLGGRPGGIVQVSIDIPYSCNIL
ncbi:hypothetical protein BHE74_00006652 [Ensete ventricosum]|nr:hypothetical protein BHE74_00006652 [Ensete ventricosum]